MTAKGTTKTAIDRRLMALADDPSVGSGVGIIEKRIVDLMNRAEAAGNYSIGRMQSTDPIFGMLNEASRAAGQRVASPIQLTKKRVQELIAMGTDAMDEQFLVNQYNYGEFIRAFKEAGDFQFSTQELSRIQTILGRDLSGLDSTAIQTELAQAIQAGGDIGRQAEAFHALMYNNRALEALQKRENIGQYVNRMTIAAASGDQEAEIFSQLSAKGLGSRVQAVRDATKIALISPSDVVDIITNMSGNQKLYGTERFYEAALAMLEGQGIDKDAAVIAFERIAQKQGIDLSESVAQAAIESKFERIGRLRALGMEAGLSDDLLAGIDTEFLRQRLKNTQDQMRAIESLQRGFSQEMARASTVTDDMTAYLAQITEARRTKDNNLLENISRLAGLSADSAYAHASQNAKLGENAKNALDARIAAMNARSSMSHMSEVNVSRDASKIAQNILDEYIKMADDNSDLLGLLARESNDIADTSIAEAQIKRMMIGDKVRGMIFSAASETEGTTIQDILDNMERLSNTSTYRKARGYQKLVTATGDENDLINMVKAAQNAREIKFLRRQGMLSNLEELSDEMVNTFKDIYGKSNQERQEILEESKAVLRTFMNSSSSSGQALRTGVGITDDQRMTMALIRGLGDGTFLDSLGLAQEAQEQSRAILNMANAKRYLAETGMEEMLTYGGSNAAAFAPENIDDILSSEERQRVIAGLGDDSQEAFVKKSSYKRLGESWREGKLGEAFKNPMVKKSAYGALGLMAASFIYSASKDRTPEDAAGPPLLPGGSAYEPLPSRAPQVPNASMFSGYNEGLGYNVHIEGSQDQLQTFRESAGSVAKGPINSTMSRGLPQLGRDPYSQIAGSF
jgi:hypothetical protein